MTISEALAILESCDWLKITERHVSAVKRKTDQQVLMMPPDQRTFYHAHVSAYRKKAETLESLLIRSAELVEAGHLPKVRVPAQTSEDRCACGAKGDGKGLVWDQKLQQRLCHRCELAWARAALTNDITPVTSTSQH